MSKKIDITSEQWREYATADGLVYRIENPVSLFLTDDGSHRVVDIQGVTHRPPRFGKEYAVRWLPKPGSPEFVA